MGLLKTTITTLSIVPGDFTGVQVKLVNTDTANPATITYFYGEKG